MKGTPREYSLLAEDKAIGEENPLQEQIVEVAGKVRQIEEINGLRHPKSIKGRNILRGLIVKQREAREIWANIRRRQERVLEKAFQNPEISMLKPELSQAEKGVLLPFIKKHILSLEDYILAESIFFIKEVSSD